MGINNFTNNGIHKVTTNSRIKGVKQRIREENLLFEINQLTQEQQDLNLNLIDRQVKTIKAVEELEDYKNKLIKELIKC